MVWRKDKEKGIGGGTSRHRVGYTRSGERETIAQCVAGAFRVVPPAEQLCCAVVPARPVAPALQRLSTTSAVQATNMPNFLKNVGIVQARGAGDDRPVRCWRCRL